MKISLISAHFSSQPGLFTSRGCCRLCCEERSECGNLMLDAKNDEITTLSSIARDDVVVHRDWVATKQMQ
jgi:hypothetical protein